MATRIMNVVSSFVFLASFAFPLPVLCSDFTDIEHIEVRGPESHEEFPSSFHNENSESSTSSEHRGARVYNHFFDKVEQSNAPVQSFLEHEDEAICKLNDEVENQISNSGIPLKHAFLISGIHVSKDHNQKAGARNPSVPTPQNRHGSYPSAQGDQSHPLKLQELCNNLKQATQECSPVVRHTQNSECPVEATMADGSLLVMYNDPVLLHTSMADIKIAAHTQVFVIQLDNQIGIYDMMDSHNGAVSVNLNNGAHYNLNLREGMIVSKQGAADFKNLELSKGVRFKNIHHLGNERGGNIESPQQALEAFKGDFSYCSLIGISPQFLVLIKSECPHDRNIAFQLLKTLASIESMQRL